MRAYNVQADRDFSRAKYLLVSILVVASWLNVNAQTAKVQFDVASVKQVAAVKPNITTSNGPGGVTTVRLTSNPITGGPGSSTPDRYSYRGATFRSLLVRAYGLVDRDQQITGPGWIDSEHYDVTVTMPASTTEPVFRQMLQNLLVERFQLVVHHDSKLLSVYELTVAKNGPKLKESTPPPPPEETPAPTSGPMKKGEDGFPITSPGYHGVAMMSGPGPSGQITQNWFYGQYTMAEFAGSLKSDAGRNIIDKTGLVAKYDFKLYYEPNRPGTAPDHPLLTVFEALEQQLGLKLVDAKAPFEVIVMDSAERVPTEN